MPVLLWLVDNKDGNAPELEPTYLALESAGFGPTLCRTDSGISKDCWHSALELKMVSKDAPEGEHSVLYITDQAGKLLSATIKPDPKKILVAVAPYRNIPNDGKAQAR
jgi:hypothetical protein